jgi:Flp pilus assembly secretin CpaC
MTPRFPSILLTVFLGTAVVGAQEKADKPHRTPTPLKLQVTLARYQGEKKVSSSPYTLSLSADDRPVRMRMGTQIPIQVKDTPGQVVYKDVGNNIDCSAETLADGRFKLACTFEQSSVYAADVDRKSAGVADVSLGSVPLFRMFRSDVTLFLRDGQSGQYTAATDPVSGEVLRVDVSLDVLK